MQENTPHGKPKIFQSMFPDSKIANGYKMMETKIKYLIQFGISPNILEQVKEDMKGYIQYQSTTYNKIINHYVGLLFLGHYKSELRTNLKWDITLLLHIGMEDQT